MAKICALCGKSKTSGHQVSHSNIKTKRSWRPNVHKIKIMYKGTPVRKYVCTRCLKSGRVQRAP